MPNAHQVVRARSYSSRLEQTSRSSGSSRTSSRHLGLAFPAKYPAQRPVGPAPAAKHQRPALRCPRPLSQKSSNVRRAKPRLRRDRNFARTKRIPPASTTRCPLLKGGHRAKQPTPTNPRILTPAAQKARHGRAPQRQDLCQEWLRRRAAQTQRDAKSRIALRRARRPSRVIAHRAESRSRSATALKSSVSARWSRPSSAAPDRPASTTSIALLFSLVSPQRPLQPWFWYWLLSQSPTRRPPGRITTAMPWTSPL